MTDDKGAGLIPESLLEEVMELSRAQKLRLMQILSEDLGERDWVYRAYTPDGDSRAAEILLEMADSAKTAQQATAS